MQSPPPGTVCANHPDTPASATCAQCARAVCNSCVVFDAAGAARCTACATVVHAGDGMIPWERRAEVGTVAAFLQTVKAALLRPQECLGPAPGPVRVGAPFGFAVICHTLGFVFAMFWQAVMTVVTMRGLDLGVGAGEAAVLGAMGIVAGPFAAAYWVFVWGGIVHLFLLLFGAARGGFAATARVQGYASATALWQIVPLLGGMMAVVWSIVAQILGLAAAHGTSAGRTTAAVLAPLAVCCVLAFGLVVVMATGFSTFLPDQ